MVKKTTISDEALDLLIKGKIRISSKKLRLGKYRILRRYSPKV